MFVADPSGRRLAVILWTILGGYLAAGGAGAINHFVDRDRDARMARTCDRPLVDAAGSSRATASSSGSASAIASVARVRARGERARGRPRPHAGCSATCSSTPSG